MYHGRDCVAADQRLASFNSVGSPRCRNCVYAFACYLHDGSLDVPLYRVLRRTLALVLRLSLRGGVVPSGKSGLYSGSIGGVESGV